MSPPDDEAKQDGVPQAFRGALQALYDDLETDVRRAGPTCALSGRCCRFAEYGHTLFVSGPEFATLLAEAPAPVRPIDDGATCPWQDHRGHCTARSARPLGCRVYYCDPDFEERCRELGESYVGRLKELTDRHGLPWDYAPLHTHLRRAVEAGLLAEPSDSASRADGSSDR